MLACRLEWVKSIAPKGPEMSPSPSAVTTLEVRTSSQIQLVDLTDRVEQVVSDSGIAEGCCVVYCPHTTAAVTIQENADPGLCDDLVKHLGGMFPRKGAYRHCEDNAQSHLLAALIGPSETIPISKGRLLLGRWQAVYFFDLDGPRERRVLVKLLPG